MIVDSYVHCGRSKYRTAEDVVRTLDDASVERAVLVQHLGEHDNSYIGHAIAAERRRLAGVALINMEDDWRKELQSLHRNRGWRAVRVNAATMRGAPALCHAVLDSGLELVIYVGSDGHELGPTINRLAASAPNRKLIVSHYGLAAGHQWYSEGCLAEQVSSHPNVMLLLSGHSMFAASPFTELVEPTRSAINWYGVERLLWGSNYPVCGEGAEYSASLEFLSSSTLSLAPNAIEKIAGLNGYELWFGA